MLTPCIRLPLRFAGAVFFIACLFIISAHARTFLQQSNTQSAQQHYDAAMKLFKKGSYSKAVQEAEGALTIDSDFAPALLLKSRALVGVFKKKYNTGSEYHRGSGSAELDPSFMLLKQAADDLERYLKLSPPVVDSDSLREELETLRAYANLTDQDDAARTVCMPREVTLKARLLDRPGPKYGGPGGTVILLIILTADKQVDHIAVISSPNEDATKACIEAARNIKFEPAVRNGHAVSVVIQIEYNFS